MDIDEVSWLRATGLEIVSSQAKVEAIVESLQPALAQKDQEQERDEVYWYVVKNNG